MKKQGKKFFFWMLCNLTKEWYLCCHKHHWYKSQWCSQIFIPMKASFCWKDFNNQFNNLIIAVEFPSRQIKDSCYTEAATKSHIGILRFWSKSLKNTCERYHFWQYCSLLKRNSFTSISQRILLIDSVGKIIEQLFWRNLSN